MVLVVVFEVTIVVGIREVIPLFVVVVVTSFQVIVALVENFVLIDSSTLVSLCSSPPWQGNLVHLLTSFFHNSD